MSPSPNLSANEGISVSLLILSAWDTDGASPDDKRMIFFTHRRRSDKKVYPGLWGLGAGGKADPGENPLQAMIREAREELGLVLGETLSDTGDNRSFFRELGQFDWKDGPIVYAGTLFHAHFCKSWRDLVLTPCPREFDQWQWRTPAEIADLIRTNQMCPDTAWAWQRWGVG